VVWEGSEKHGPLPDSMGERWKQAMDSWQQELGAGSEETSGMCACCLQVLCTAPALYPTRTRRDSGTKSVLERCLVEQPSGGVIRRANQRPWANESKSSTVICNRRRVEVKRAIL